MSRADFIQQLRDLGHEPQDLGDGKVVVPYTVPLGRFNGQEIRLGFTVADDFPLSVPGTLHVSPRLLPLKSGGSHPDGGVHDSPFGTDWQYWSRPMHHWSKTKRSARDIMAFVNRLFDTQ